MNIHVGSSCTVVSPCDPVSVHEPDSSCSPGVFKSSVDAELGAIGAASELSGTLVSELDVCAVVIC